MMALVDWEVSLLCSIDSPSRNRRAREKDLLGVLTRQGPSLFTLSPKRGSDVFSSNVRSMSDDLHDSETIFSSRSLASVPIGAVAIALVPVTN
jgi:hypothetical protein